MPHVVRTVVVCVVAFGVVVAAGTPLDTVGAVDIHAVRKGALPVDDV